MQRTTAGEPAGGDAATSNDPMAVLWQHERHVLVLTRAGKPVFSQHGDEEKLSPLCALLQVLLHIHNDEAEAEQGQGPSQLALASDSAASSVTVKDEVRQVVYYRALATPNDARSQSGMDLQALTLFFYVEGELMYVMSERSVALSPSAEAGETSSGEGDCKPPPVASYSLMQLRHVHHSILLVLPTINTLLERTPGLDVRATYTSADRAALRELIESYETERTYSVGAVATLALAKDKRRVVEEALLQCYRSSTDAAVSPPAHQLFSFLYFKNYLVAAVGPPETYSTDPSIAASAPLALGPETALCGSLHIDDALLLYRYARSLVSRQAGEAWVPVCLPRFNSTGYLWCYAVDFTCYVRELRQQQVMSVWPRMWEAHTGLDLLLLHVSASQDDFTALSRCTRRFAQLLYAPTVGDNFCYRLEEELYYRAPAPLAELLSLSRMSPPACSAYDVSGRPSGVPLWYSLVIQDSDAAFLDAAEGEEAKAASRATAASTRTHDCPSASIRLLFESQPSPLLSIATVEDVKDFQQLVVRYQSQLCATPSSPSTPCMLLVRHDSAITLAAVRPTPATLATLASYFFSPKNPFNIPSEGAAADGGAAGACDQGELGAAAASRRGVSSSTWVEAVCALGVTELTAAFPAAIPEAMAWYWVAHLLFMAVQRRGRFVVRQLIGGRR
ncbi:hypothetical protein LSCM1_02086 [Leishmania martiniquensis]|uniref:FUZ/MON1/HPS1 second Longin domain-containing protein n=1 Tax=Leishmania martiniquensis TaxID=1580590 RepID=A0A836H0G0_9TRYP|nr:hypothetical protein LSCM1_02086 [Leishmania martiniquensis]